MKTLVLYLLSTSAIAQSLPPAAAPSGGFPVWAMVLIAGGLLVGGYIYLKRKDPAAAAKIEAGADRLKDSLTDLLHKQADTQATQAAVIAAQATVIASPPVQAAVNAAAPVAKVAEPAHDPEYVYLGDPGYPPSQVPPLGNGYPILRTSAGLPRLDKGNPNYHEGDTIPGKVATPEQMEWIRTSWNSALPQEERTAANRAILASLGYPGDDAPAGSPANVALAQFLAANPVAS